MAKYTIQLKELTIQPCQKTPKLKILKNFKAPRPYFLRNQKNMKKLHIHFLNLNFAIISFPAKKMF
jgi:hypothetical protein